MLQVYVEFDDDSGRRSPRYSTSTHEVVGVVDAQSKRVMTFSDAVRRRILDPATATYHDPQSSRLVYPADAIRQGLVKTRLMSNYDGDCAAWLVAAGRPVLPGELGAVVRMDSTSDDVFLPGELPRAMSSAPASLSVPASSCRTRRSISGWQLDF